MALIFRKIESGDIFTRDFSPLVRNNEIAFPTSEEIAVIYGPNGTGKTSLIKVLGDARDTKVEFTLDGTEYRAGAEVFILSTIKTIVISSPVRPVTSFSEIISGMSLSCKIRLQQIAILLLLLFYLL